MAPSKPKLQLNWKKKGDTYSAEVGDRTIYIERMPFADKLAYSWSGFGNLVSHKWVVAGATPAETKRHAEAAWFKANPADARPPTTRRRGRPALGAAKKSNAERSKARLERRQAEMLAAFGEREAALLLAVQLLAEFSAVAGDLARQAFLDRGRAALISGLAASLRKFGEPDGARALASAFKADP